MLKGIWIDGLKKSDHHKMRRHWSTHALVSQHVFGLHEASLQILQKKTNVHLIAGWDRRRVWEYRHGRLDILSESVTDLCLTNSASNATTTAVPTKIALTVGSSDRIKTSSCTYEGHGKYQQIQSNILQWNIFLQSCLTSFCCRA